MNKTIDYKTAEKLSLEWNKSKGLIAISFIDSTCVNCKEFDELVIPEILNAGINHYSVDLKTNKVPFPPMQTPVTYWYFVEDYPPMMKKGHPPTKDMLIDFLSKIKKVFNNESTVEKEFF